MMTADECPDKTNHTPCPETYRGFVDWADNMSKTHKQIKCPSCNLFAIWILKGE
jgi:hypothetical protein